MPEPEVAHPMAPGTAEKTYSCFLFLLNPPPWWHEWVTLSTLAAFQSASMMQISFKENSIPYKIQVSLNRTNRFLWLTFMISCGVCGCVSLIEIYVWNCKLYTLKAKFSANISRLSTQSPMPTHRIQHHGTWTCSKHLGGVFWGVYGDTVNHTPDHPHSSLTPQIYGSVWVETYAPVLDLSYINIQPHTLFRFVCVQTHKHAQTQIRLDV